MDVLKKLFSSFSVTDNDDDKEIVIPKSRLFVESFKFGKELGSGSFGQVFVAEFKNPKNNSYFAIKRLSKNFIVKNKQVDHVNSERKILSSISHKFIVNMYGSFKDTRYLYIILELIDGGEFFTHLRERRKFIPDHCRFYAAQIVLIFEYLHSKNIIYRDLKPENLLLNKDGYLKLTDFGFAKVVESRTFTLCGTPEYLAPEVLLNQGHGKAVDWWTLGILIFEMAYGFPPFFSDEPMEIYRKILKGTFCFPRIHDKFMVLLIQSLLTADLTRRYGTLKNGVNDVKNHKWFDGMNWNDMLKLKLDPPFKPNIPDISQVFTNYQESSNDCHPPACSSDPFVGW